MPYITQRPEQCSSCDTQAIAKVVLMPNGFVIRCCTDHLLQLAKIKQAENKELRTKAWLDTISTVHPDNSIEGLFFKKEG